MHLGPIAAPERVPAVHPDLAPPFVHGVAALAHRAYARPGLDDLLAFLDRDAHSPAEQAALLLDRSWANALHFRAAEAAELQARALEACQLFRVADDPPSGSARPLRLLALLAPGTLMVNTPLDFITRHLDVRLDLLFVPPERPLPDWLPDHDVAFVAASECEPATLRRLRSLCAAWPRPVLNDPAAIARLSRDALACGFADMPGIYSPPALRLGRSEIERHLAGADRVGLLDSGVAILIRPVASHAGEELEKIGSGTDLASYLARSNADEFFATEFADYRSADGLFRKSRVAFIDGAPFLCHQASSPHWMVHYLNAGMAEHPERRADEARAMTEFDGGFALRHARAFAALCDWAGLDYFQIDCAELADGRLLVFEAAVAGIVHLMDPPDLFPYKPAQMRRVFAAFDAMLHSRANRS